MEGNTRKHMDDEMDRIRADLLKLGGLAESAVRDAVWALAKQDLDLAAKVVAGDDEVDALANRLDTDCFQFIARYQPLAADLRTAAALIKAPPPRPRAHPFAQRMTKGSGKGASDVFSQTVLVRV